MMKSWSYMVWIFFFSEPAEPEENYDDFSEVIEQEHFFKFTFQSVCVCACVWEGLIYHESTFLPFNCRGELNCVVKFPFLGGATRRIWSSWWVSLIFFCFTTNM